MSQGFGQLRNEPQLLAGCVLQQSDLLDETGPYVNSFPSPQPSQRAPLQVDFLIWASLLPALALTFYFPGTRKEGVSVLTQCQDVLGWEYWPKLLKSHDIAGLSHGARGQMLQWGSTCEDSAYHNTLIQHANPDSPHPVRLFGTSSILNRAWSGPHLDVRSTPFIKRPLREPTALPEEVSV